MEITNYILWSNVTDKISFTIVELSSFYWFSCAPPLIPFYYLSFTTCCLSCFVEIFVTLDLFYIIQNIDSHTFVNHPHALHVSHFICGYQKNVGIVHYVYKKLLTIYTCRYAYAPFNFMVSCVRLDTSQFLVAYLYSI